MARVGDAPCLHCGSRYFGCHGHCEAYRAYRIRREAIRAQRIREGDLTDGKRKSADRYAPKHNQWRGGAE